MPRSTLLAPPMPRIRAWLDRWGDIVPLLLAEFIVWLGFGALLPVLPLYFTEQGVDLALLGLVIAAWPAARLVGEPIFGYLADRTARVPIMVVGLIATGIFSFLPLEWMPHKLAFTYGPDGRPPARAGDRCPRCRVLRRDLVRLRVRRDRRLAGRDPDRAARSRDR